MAHMEDWGSSGGSLADTSIGTGDRAGSEVTDIRFLRLTGWLQAHLSSLIERALSATFELEDSLLNGTGH